VVHYYIIKLKRSGYKNIGGRKLLRNIVLDIHGPLVPVGETFTAPFYSMCVNLISTNKKINKKKAEQILKDGLNKFKTGSGLMEHLGVYKEYLEGFYSVGYHVGKDEELIDLLKDIKESGGALMICSNNPRGYAVTQLEKIGLPAGLFDKIVTASEARFRPYKDQFEILVGNNNKSEFVFLADRPFSDIQVAREFGIKAILTQNPEETREVLKGLLWQLRMAAYLNKDYSIDREKLLRGEFKSHLVNILLNHPLGENIFGRSAIKIEHEGYGQVFPKTAEKIEEMGNNIFMMYATLSRAQIPLAPAMLRHIGIIHRSWSDEEAQWLTDSILKALKERKAQEYFAKVLYAFYPTKSRCESTRVMASLEKKMFFDDPREDKIGWFGEVSFVLRRAAYLWKKHSQPNR